MKRISIYVCLCFLMHTAFAQSDTVPKTTVLDEVIFSVNKFAEQKRNVAQKIDVISARNIAQVNAQNTGDLLINTGQVFVQKSQQGGSSPVLRGFEASRVLLVIDGIRMNNAVYRAGHLQNIITVDQNMLDRVEVMFGPASTIYGSDALGGVIHLRTKAPKVSGDRNFFSTGGAFARYSSANDEKTIHTDLSIGGKKFAWLQAYTYSYFGDMRMGNNYPDAYPNFGRRSQYVTTINGIDSVVKNSDDRREKFSGYEQWDITQKFLYKQSEKVSHLLNVQFSNSTNVPRYDRLQDIRNGTLRYAEWFYGPQERLLASYELNASSVGFFNDVRVNVNYQDIKESRQQRDYRRYDRFDSRREHVKVWGFTVDGRKLWGNNELTIGIDGQFNDVKSVADRTNLTTGAVTKLDSRYPDGKNTMNYYAVYAQHNYKFKDGRFILNDGIRLQATRLNSNIVDNSFFNFPFTNITQNSEAVTGNVGLVYLPSRKSKLALSLASGFRAPNIDDVTKIFESSTALGQVVVPNPDLKPEYTYNADLSFTTVIAEKLRVELTGFYTLFRNVSVKAPYQLNGMDSIMYNGVNCQVMASQNRNKAKVYGANANLGFNITPNFLVFGSVTFTKGVLSVDPKMPSLVFIKRSNGQYIDSTMYVSEKPLDHIPPVYGKFGAQFTKNKFNTELSALYNGWKRIEDFNADGEDNAQYAAPNGYTAGSVIPDGFPSWVMVNWRAAYDVTKKFTVQVAVENILDRNYRQFASGYSAAGRNFIVAVRGTF